MKEETLTLMNDIENKIIDHLQDVRNIVTWNQEKVLAAFRYLRVGDVHFNPTTGYGYDDLGREKLEELYAAIFHTEDALVRQQMVSGTHAISTALFAILRPGDTILSLTGNPYDTLEGVIGASKPVDGSLTDYGILYQVAGLLPNGSINYSLIEEQLKNKPKAVMIQRSRGYADRPSFHIEEIKTLIQFVKERSPETIIFVDNCYGEFVETQEPTDVGADLIAGSLIKNPGAGIVKTGGYIAGKKYLIEKCANRLTAPGLGKETGASLNSLQEMFQGIFLAPHTVGEALKGAYFTAQLLSDHGYKTTPSVKETRTDLIQSITFDDKEAMVAFAQMIQQNSPINAYVSPQPSYMPGYEHDVIMAAGTFIQGASLELTADGPIRPPYTLFVQGGLTYEHVKIAIVQGIQALQQK
ncbi:aminotransferase class I/II-fold pyridoxal phosphate-dependent enzyme [Halalkalibacillus halophilus]|uniref:methionine gamma-lyase family protein n=1 Tax=Halalkalibacillus halophilus TaxID=392827 RepID=UPI0003F5CE1B|nr:methionine gamma-lyase family protein [Halalkalibacillus halophilus]